MAAGTASVSGSGGSVPASNTATVTSAPTASPGSSGGTTGGGSGTGSGNTFTGYSSVSPIATASVIGAAAQVTPVINAIRYVVPVVMVGAAVL